jgi:hypothetical protein
MIHEKKGIYNHYNDELKRLNFRLACSISGLFELSSTDALTDLINALESEVFMINNNAFGTVRIVGIMKDMVDLEDINLGLLNNMSIIDLPIHIKLFIIKQLDK